MVGALPPIFAGLTLEEQQEASSYLSSVDVGPGEAIMLQGEEDTTLAFVAKGTCEVFRNETKIGAVGARELVGEVEAFAQCPRVNTITAANDVTLQVLAPEAYAALAEAGNPIVYRLERAVIRRISERIAKLNEGVVQYAQGAPFELHPKGASLVERLTAPFRKRRAPDIDAAEVLARSELFSWAPGHLIQDIAEHFQVERFDPEHILCREGEAGDRMFLIASGRVEVVVMVAGERAQSIATLRPGQAFGDTSMALVAPRTATCVSRDEVVALTMDRHKFKELYDSDEPGGSAFRQGIVRNLIAQLVPTMDRYVEALTGATPPDEGLYKGTPVNAVWRD